MADDVERRHLVIVVVVPDRPGALGAVASRVGALGTDITDIHFGERGGGNVEITFHLDLPSANGGAGNGRAVDFDELLLFEMQEVDGVTIKSQTDASCCRQR